MTIIWQVELASRLDASFDAYEQDIGPLPGLTPGRREGLIRHIVGSSRLNWYVEHLCSSSLSADAANPSSHWFNPLKAAVIRHRAGDDEEAFWLAFLLTHFGKHRRTGWQYVRNIYGALGADEQWTWDRITTGTSIFRDWLDAHQAEIVGKQRMHGFGNHRKYESLAGWTANGTGSVVASYVDWVGIPPLHRRHFDTVLSSADGEPELAFDLLYRSLKTVRRFGRLGSFDYLSMVGRLGLADIRPGRSYLQGSTGPLKGARLLFQDPTSAISRPRDLEEKTVALGSYLGVSFDVLEDALCNWQKSPEEFKPFRG